MTRTTIRSEDITAGQVKSADLASDAVDTTGLETDIALLGFKVAANGSLAAYNLQDQTVDAFMDATGIDAGSSTNETRNASNYYSGSAIATITGGTITTYGDYKIHTFTSSGTFTTDTAGTADILLLAGGGGGGDSGGGGGGVREFSAQSVSATSHTITIGLGGASNTQGTDSTAFGFTANGGGYGGRWNQDGGIGGSGGGASGHVSGGTRVAGTGNEGGFTPSEGNDGGDGAHLSGTSASGGGGGGAGSAGGDASANGLNGGAGGNGLSNSWQTGVAQFYGGGGGGGAFNSSNLGGSAGSGGGGRGFGSGGAYASGTANTGGGGGGGQHNTSTGGAGGSGIVVIRYNANTGFSNYENLTLVSNATTAETAPTTGDIVMTYTNGAGTATVNTDLKAWVSRDNGTTYTQATLSSQGTTGGHTILTAHNVDISSQPSGTSMRYKITTHNQSASKETRIQAVSLGWA